MSYVLALQRGSRPKRLLHLRRPELCERTMAHHRSVAKFKLEICRPAFLESRLPEGVLRITAPSKVTKASKGKSETKGRSELGPLDFRSPSGPPAPQARNGTRKVQVSLQVLFPELPGEFHPRMARQGH